MSKTLPKKTRVNTGFDGRVFLTSAEWETYLRTMPVRYIKKGLKNCCEICGLPAMPGNPFQNAHRIPFGLGVSQLGLTPDYVISDVNIVTAHKQKCNKEAELDLAGAMVRLKAEGVDALPTYLPEEIRRYWEDLHDMD